MIHYHTTRSERWYVVYTVHSVCAHTTSTRVHHIHTICMLHDTTLRSDVTTLTETVWECYRECDGTHHPHVHTSPRSSESVCISYTYVVVIHSTIMLYMLAHVHPQTHLTMTSVVHKIPCVEWSEVHHIWLQHMYRMVVYTHHPTWCMSYP